MLRATSSFPVPVSPVIRTVAFVGATRAMSSRTFRIAGALPMISEEPSSRETVSFKRLFSRSSFVCSVARAAVARITSGRNGLVRKSKAPPRMLSTANSIEPYSRQEDHGRGGIVLPNQIQDVDS